MGFVVASLDSRSVKILGHQLREFKHENMAAILENDDLRYWIVMLHDLPAVEYKGGEFLFRMTIPDGFPHKPPRLEALTPTGVFEHKEPGSTSDAPICISIGEYHSAEWRAMTIQDFAIHIIHALIDPGVLTKGIRIISPITAAGQEKASKRSRGFNLTHYKPFVTAFDALLHDAQLPDLPPTLPSGCRKPAAAAAATAASSNGAAAAAASEFLSDQALADLLG